MFNYRSTFERIIEAIVPTPLSPVEIRTVNEFKFLFEFHSNIYYSKIRSSLDNASVRLETGCFKDSRHNTLTEILRVFAPIEFGTSETLFGN